MSDEFHLDLAAPTTVWALRDAILREGLPPGGSVYAEDLQADTLHIGAFRQADIVAVSTICRDHKGERGNHEWRLCGMAVRPEWRDYGIGTTLAGYCIAYAQRSGAKLVWCEARLSVLTFYQHLSFCVVGEPFERDEMGEEKFSRMELIPAAGTAS